MNKSSLIRAATRNRAGSSLVLVAVAFVAAAGMVAVAVEGGALYSVRSEASRAADAAALAGVSAFGDAQGMSEEELATARALEYAQANPVYQGALEEDEVEVAPLPDSGYVRVTITKEVPLRLAKLLGFGSVTVRATARASTFASGTAQCLNPIAMPDAWDDTNGDGNYTDGEYYSRDSTGYGTDFRDGDGYNNDFSRPIRLDPGLENENAHDGSYFILDLGIQGNTASVIADTTCANANVVTGTDVTVAITNGLRIGDVFNGVEDVIAYDPSMTWDGEAFTGSQYPDWRGSYRVSTVALYDPRFPPSAEGSSVTIVGFAGLYWDYVVDTGNDKHIMARLVNIRGVPDNCNATDTCAPFNGVVKLIR